MKELTVLNNELTIALKEMEIVTDRAHPSHHGLGDSRMLRVKFNNGRGASIVRFDGSYGYEQGKWEIAILDKEGELDFSTHISDDVIGHLSEKEVVEILAKISDLPKEEES